MDIILGMKLIWVVDHWRSQTSLKIFKTSVYIVYIFDICLYDISAKALIKHFVKVPNIPATIRLSLSNIQELKNAELFKRIRKLMILEIGLYSDNSDLIGISNSLSKICFPILKTLIISCDDYGLNKKLDFSGIHLPSVESILIKRYHHTDNTRPKLVLDSNSIPKLQRLTLWTEKDVSNELVNCVFKNMNPNVIDYVHLNYLDFKTFPSMFNYDQLKTLEIGELSVSSKFSNDSNQLITLKSLKGITIENLASFDHLHFLEIPSIRYMNLTIKDKQANDIGEFYFHHQQFPQIKTLKLQLLRLRFLSARMSETGSPFQVDLPTLKTVYTNKRFHDQFLNLEGVVLRTI
ncbi:hypothetical protein BN7_1349 [Wickerhamomyces ciferrii]|uniref:Uncharacterized protein n=1 Tax=Wickerhamomyces ciferrii (strain ATCC 14091 / BCRC 22168 / CBS 111 / JCM 3599 / NBRC 0793 / NRRL Y-1031 F-60-10) TaxID=1206466 RepID=K0KA59_WICCF|nr:uncharacterized protein BN7_1349 [Wickerhamomyces ciferrii]CCH41810.1 hypothetical protein BN7_1349 [Wickerhamomyces ciferrii]